MKLDLFLEENNMIIKDHLDSFDYEFNDDEKKAILGSLYVIANIDNEYHEKEKEFLHRVASYLNFNPDDILDKDTFFNDKDEICSALSNMQEGQKNWFIITAFLMIHADGVALMNEYLQLQEYFENIGVSKERWQEVIDKTEYVLNNLKTNK